MYICAETEHLILRTWKHGDKVKFDLCCNTPEVMEWLGGVQSQRELSEDVKWFGDCQNRYGHTLWVIERKQNGEFLGFCGLDKLVHDVPRQLRNEVEIGWRLAENAWGNGYATEAATVALDIAFRIRRMDRVVSRLAEGNAASRRVMEKLGLRRAPELEPKTGGMVFAMDRQTWISAN